LGSEPSKTEEKHLLPNPEFSSVLSGDFEISFFEFVFFIVCFLLISEDKVKTEIGVIPRQRKDSERKINC